MAFTGFVGANVLPASTWTRVGAITPELGDIFTVNIQTIYAPGFTTRNLNDEPAATYTPNAEGVMELTGGPDDDTVVYVAVMPVGTDTNDKDAIQKYLIAARYVLGSGVIRAHTGVMIPAGWYVYAYSSKADVSISVFGVEGRPTRFKREPLGC